MRTSTGNRNVNKLLTNLVLGGNLGDLRRLNSQALELECQQSARQKDEWEETLKTSEARDTMSTCGTATSRICTKGETLTMCSTMCCRTRPCGPGGSARPNRLKSSRWRRRAISTPLSRPGHVLSPWDCVVVTLGQSHGDAHPCTSQV